MLTALQTYEELHRAGQGTFGSYDRLAREVAVRYPAMGNFTVPYNETSVTRRRRLPNTNKKVDFVCLRPGATTYTPRNDEQLKSEGYGKTIYYL